MNDSASLVDRIREARKLTVSVDRWTFHGRRPTDIEMSILRRADSHTGDLARRFVGGWDGMRVCDLVGGADETPVPFVRELWEEWVADRPDVYGPVGTKIMTAYLEFAKAQEAALKN